MPGNLALRLGVAGQVFISKNRKVSHPWRWGSALVGGLVLATMGVLCACMCLAWTDLQFITQSYHILAGSGDPETIAGPEPQA